MPADDPTLLSQANLVAQGFNIYGSFSDASVIRPLLDAQKAKTQPFTLEGRQFLIPAFVTGVESPESSAFSNVGETRDEYQNKIALHANVEGNYGAFSGEMNADFGAAVETSAQYAFAKYTVTAQVATLGLLSPQGYLSDFFKAAVDQLPSVAAPGDLTKFSQFFEEFGIYYVRQVALGGSLSIVAQVNKASQLSEVEIAAMLKVGYDGLASSGSAKIDGSMKANWDSFRQNSTTKVQVRGGDVSLAGRLTQMDPKAPTADNVTLVTDWLKSVQAAPAVVDFQLGPIWELCGDKQGAVRDAWRIFGPQMRPAMVIQAAGSATDADSGGTPRLPTITLGSAIVAPDKPANQQGVQVVILDKSLAGTPEGILFNRYYSFSKHVVPSARTMWEQIAKDLSSSPSFVSPNLLVVATFNCLLLWPPTTDAYTLLESCGAGPELAKWEANIRDYGSNAFPAVAYALVGVINNGANSGVEAFRVAPAPNGTVTMTLQTYLYRNEPGGPFSIGLGSIN